MVKALTFTSIQEDSCGLCLQERQRGFSTLNGCCVTFLKALLECYACCRRHEPGFTIPPTEGPCLHSSPYPSSLTPPRLGFDDSSGRGTGLQPNHVFTQLHRHLYPLRTLIVIRSCQSFIQYLLWTENFAVVWHTAVIRRSSPAPMQLIV